MGGSGETEKTKIQNENKSYVMPGVDKSRGRRAAPKIDDKRSDSGAGGVAHYSIRPNQEVLTNGGLAAGGLIDKL